MSAVQQQFAAFDEAVAQDKPFQSERLADAIEALAARDPAAAPLLAERRRAVQKVRHDVKDLKELLHELRTDDGWKKSYDKKGITVHFKKPEGTPFLMTKAARRITPLEGKTLSQSFVALVSMFAEVELMPMYFPRGLMKSHETLESPTKWSRYTRMRLQMPMFVPISDREAVIKGKGYDMTEESAICIAFKSLPDDYESEDFDMPPPERKYTRMDLSGAYYFELTPDGSILLLNVQLIDLKLPFVPPIVINMLAKGALPVEFFNNLDKKFRAFEGSEWETAVAAKPETYGDVVTRLEAYLRDKGISNEPSSRHGSTTASTAAEERDGDDGGDGDSAHSVDGDNAHEPGMLHTAVRSVLSLVLTEDVAEEYAAKAAAFVESFVPGAAGDGAAGAQARPKRESVAKRLSKRLSFGRGGANPAAGSGAGKGKGKGVKLVKSKRGFSLRKKKSGAQLSSVSDADL